MNIENLQKTHHKLISFMNDAGYSKSYISKVSGEIRYILANAENCGWTSYAEIYRHREQQKLSPHTLYQSRIALRLLENYDCNGNYPNGMLQGNLSRKYDFLIEEFKAVIDAYLESSEKSGIKERTIYTRSNCATSFLFHLQNEGCKSLQDVTEKAVLSAFVSDSGEILRGSSAKKSITAVFKACVPQNPEVFTRLLMFLPQLRTARKNIQYLTPDEVSKVVQVLNDKTSALSFRDRAIATLVLYTGLRKCDIAGLKIGSIDWDNDLIHIVQQKTSVPLTLPLRPIVGNAIYDYITKERPQIDCEYIFIRQHAPYYEIGHSALNRICGKIMLASGIRQEDGDRKGFHIFRHRLVTTLLGNGVPQPVISDIVGQTSPASLKPYLYANFTNLKGCALSVERFPVCREVFGNA
jgi:integrase